VERKLLWKQIGFAFILQLVIKCIWVFVIDRNAQNNFGIDIYGRYFSYMQLLTIIVMLADFGLHNYATKYIAENNLSFLPKEIYFAKLVCTTIYLVIATLLLVTIVKEYEHKILFLLVIVLQLFNSYFLWSRSVLRGFLLNKHDAIVASIDKFIVACVALLAWLYYKQYINVYSFVWLQIMGLIVALVYSQFVMPSNQKILPAHLSQQTVIQVMVKAFPLGILLLLMTAVYRQDAYLLAVMHPEKSSASGVYAMGFRLLDAANMLGYIIATYFFSFCVANANNITFIQTTAFNLTKFLMVLSAMGIAFCMLFAKQLALLLYHTEYMGVVSIIKYIMVVFPALLLVHIYGTVLATQKNVWPFVIITAIACIINLLCNYLLIPVYNILGTLLAAIVTQYIYAAMCIYLVNNINNTNNEM
jgi:O-antigen/teichoic acid export membrane protein